MWSLKLTVEQRYKYFEPILPDIRADIKLFWDLWSKAYGSLTYYQLYAILIELYNKTILNSFMIERTMDNNYQITFYE